MSDTAISETLDRLAAAWNASDGAAYGAEFTDDATYVTFTGDVLRGRTAIAETHQWLFDGPLAGTRMAAAGAGLSDIRFVRPGVAHVVIDGGVALPGQDAVPEDRASTVTFLLLDTGGTWRIAAFQNTRRTTVGRS